MATLPSGSLEDVVLVQIETVELSIIIKGKPYHARYESLRQYRSMDFQDVMDFVVDGENIQDIKVYDVNENQLIEPGALRPIFFENGIYQLIVVAKQDQDLTFEHEHPVLRQAISSEKIGKQKMLMGNLVFQNEVGLTTFKVYNNRMRLVEVTLEIFPEKLDYRNDYKNLLDEVNEEIYNLAYHFIRKTYLGAKIKLDGKPSRAEFFRLINHHFHQLIKVITNIENQPNHLLQTSHEKVRGDQIGRVDSKVRSYLRKRPHLFAEVEKGIPINTRQLMPVSGLRIKKNLIYDTNENRYIKWMMQRLIHKLEDLKSTIDKQNKRFKQKADMVLKENITNKIDQLKIKLEQPFWRAIRKLDRSIMSLVLQMAPNYRDAFHIFLILSRGIELQGKVYQMAVKDIAMLYEYWTFLKLGQILGKHYELISQDTVKVNQNGLYVILDAGQTARRIYQQPITKEQIILTYQKYERSPTVAQKPDAMLSIEKKGKDYRYNFIFDAKYRIDYAQDESYYKRRYSTPGPLEEDINTMHRYRDSIVTMYEGPFEQKAFGGYVLFPWFDEQSYQQHYFYKSIDHVNIGGLPFLPNATTLVEKFVRRLIDKSPEEIQKEGILPRGTVQEWQSSLDEFVIVGLINSNNAYQQSMQNGVYSLSISKLKKNWRKANYVALYVSKGVGKEHGVAYYGRIDEVSMDGDQVNFSIEVWERLPHVIKPVQYGISNYVLTTLMALKESKELPELFMKSKTEVMIWRMLRRVSDQIKLELNNQVLDEATMVQEFKIKNVTVRIFPETSEIEFDNGYKNVVLTSISLEKNLSGAFRKMIELVVE